MTAQADIIFEGKFDNDKLEAYIEDDSLCYRLQGRLSDFISCGSESVSFDDLSESIGLISFSYKESPGTIYYVSEKYVTLNLDTDSDGNADTFMDVSAEDESISAVDMNAYAFLYWQELSAQASSEKELKSAEDSDTHLLSKSDLVINKQRGI